MWWRTLWPHTLRTTWIVLNMSTIILLEGAHPRAPLVTPRIRSRVSRTVLAGAFVALGGVQRGKPLARLRSARHVAVAKVER